MRASSPAAAPISTICASTGWRTPSCCARRMPMPGSTSIDADAARRAPGVLAVLTAADAARDGLKPLRPYAEANVQTGEPLHLRRRSRCSPTTRCASPAKPVAMVVAETHAQALDAAELVAVDYEPLPAVTSAEAAARGRRAASLARSAGQCLHRLAHRRRRGRRGGLRPGGAHRQRSTSTTTASSPTRWSRAAASAQFDPASGRYTLHVSSQNIHINRNHVARALGVEPKDVRFIAPDVGGGFGAKNFVYAEHVLIAVGGAQAHRPAGEMDRQPQRSVPGRPCRARHAGRGGAGARRRGQVPGAQGRQRRQSRRLSWRAPAAACRPTSTSTCRARCIACPSIALHVVAVLSNTAPIGVTRGPGFAETVNILERLIDAAAQQHRLRPRRAAPAQHGAGRRDADDQRLRLPGRQRRLSRDLRPGAGPRRPGGLRRAAPAERGARASCAAWASPITSRAPAARRRRMSTSASSPTARCR